MAKKFHTHRPGTGIVRTMGQTASGGIRSLSNGIRELTHTLKTTDTPDRWNDDILRHLGSLVDSVTTGIISLDGEGRIRVFNAATEKLFGLPRAMVLNRHMREIGQIMGFDDHAQRELWERLTDAVWAAGAALDLEYALAPKNGPRRVVSYSVYPLGRMAWSIGNGVVIMLEDITRKKEMEDQVSDARKRLLAVFEGITDGIQVVDSDFRITAVNKSMTALLSRSIKIGEHCYEACAFDSTICIDCPAKETFRTGQPSSITKKLMQPEGSAGARDRSVEISTFPLVDRGNRVIQVVEYIKDVTEKVLLAERLEQSRRLAELGEMAARVAHEVRNPLNAITGAAHYLSTEYAGDETLQKFTKLIERQAIRVNQVASDLLYVSKPIRTRFTTVQVSAVLDQALDSLCEQLRDQGIAVVQTPGTALPPIEADEIQLEQALHNILRNAVEAMPDGGTLRMATAVVENGARIEIRIQDSGQGIPGQDRERIFQSFYTTKIKGTGLGLTIVQRVLKNHGGEIVLEQPETGGTRVLVRLPVRNERGIRSAPDSDIRGQAPRGAGTDAGKTASSRSVIHDPKPPL